MNRFQLPPLPIDQVLPGLRRALNSGNSAVLSAEPGSGKTTIVPLALLDEPWLGDARIIMLEPRRIAARMAAARLSQLAGDRVGGLVGYRIRFENTTSARTRIEVVTEGVFLRMVQNDPELSGVGLVIFDEFHNRSLASDLALAFCLDCRELRDDLRVLIMSATMDTDRIAKLLDNAPVLQGEGRCYPVTVIFRNRPSSDPLVRRTLGAIHRALEEQEGDLLVFLPGAGEIRTVMDALEADVLCLPLYGDLPQDQQDRIFQPTEQRRVILATPIAETSLTIEGVSTVIDSGLVKVPRFSPATGLTGLYTIPVSRASADQRAGRAGRTAPGVCYRMWTEGEHHSRPDFLPAEIIDADLAPLLLETLHWGVHDPGELRWLDPPRQGQLRQARELLIHLGGLRPGGGLTTIGRKMAALPLHPRLALMLLRAREQGHGPLACRLAALVQQRDLFRGREQVRSVDIEDRLELLALMEKNRTGQVRARGGDPALCRRVLREETQYRRLLKVRGGIGDVGAAGSLLALAYPDRIAARQKDSSRYLLASGTAAMLPGGDHLLHAPYLCAAHLGGTPRQARMHLAASLDREDILSSLHHLLVRKERIFWNGQRVEGVSLLCLGELELDSEPIEELDPDRVLDCLLEGIGRIGAQCLGWSKKSRALQARLLCARHWDPANWPDVADSALITRDVLSPWLIGMHSLKQVKTIDPGQVMLGLLGRKKQGQLDRLLPERIQVPSGSRIRLEYRPGEAPVLAVRLQEMFGAVDTPTVFDGRVPVLVHLLSPAQRPVQITGDLRGFWETSYQLVRKEMAGRYPKHHWPEDPMQALPSRKSTEKKCR